MMLTAGQLYFYIFCKWFAIAFIAKLLYDALRIYLLAYKCSCKGISCKGLQNIEQDIKNLKEAVFHTNPAKEE